MFEEVAQALDDGEAEAAVAAAIGEPIEFAKNLAPVLLRDSRAGVHTSMRKALPRRRQPTSTPPDAV
jgi:hypothetical protein